MIHLHVAYFFAMFIKFALIFLTFLMEFTLQAPFGIIFLQKILHKSILCEENLPRFAFSSNFHPQYQLAGPFSWFSADRLHAGWCSAGCLSSFWLPKVVYQVPSANSVATLGRALFSHRFLDPLFSAWACFGHVLAMFWACFWRYKLRNPTFFKKCRIFVRSWNT